MMLDTQKVLAANLSELLDRYKDGSRLNLSKKMGVADGTLGRIKYGTGNPTLEALERIAKHFKIETWQLLIPGMQPSTGGAPVDASWPFRRVELSRVERLSPEDRSFIEGRLLSEIEKCEAGVQAISEAVGVRQV